MNISCCANQHGPGKGGGMENGCVGGRKHTHPGTHTQSLPTFPAKFTLKGAPARSHNFLLTKVFAVKFHRSNLQEVWTQNSPTPKARKTIPTHEQQRSTYHGSNRERSFRAQENLRTLKVYKRDSFQKINYYNFLSNIEPN